jgi:hypothetical protein
VILVVDSFVTERHFYICIGYVAANDHVSGNE